MIATRRLMTVVRWRPVHVWLVCCFAFAGAVSPDAAAAEGGAPCAACHADTAAAFTDRPHARAGVSCGACHGDGAAHMRAPADPAGMLSFHDEPAAQRSAPCADCHQATVHPNSAHQNANIACNECHSVHATAAEVRLTGEFINAGPESSACYRCHEDTFSQFSFNEGHRLAQGSVGCTDCHDPHGPATATQLGGFDQDQCATCHVDTTGPFIYEHAASRTEGCTACHAPHGSPNRHMLNHQQVGELCYTCHAAVPQFHLGFSPVGAPRFDETTVCTNCHQAIHGSNLDRLFLR